MNTSRSKTAGVLAGIVSMIVVTQAHASVVWFDNPSGAAHYNWIPLTNESLYLDITSAPDSQPSGFGNGSTFAQENVIGQLGSVVGDTEQVQTVVDTVPLLFPTLFGEAVPANPQPAGFAWDFGGIIFHPSFGTNFQDGEEVYIGVRFDPGDGFHNGWIGVEKIGLGFDTFAWGYETVPGVPIAAGVPEPGSLALLALGAGCLLRRTRRFSRQGS